MNLPSNLFENYTPPSVYLCQPDKEIIGELQVYDFSGTFKFNSYSEISFTVGRTYNDSITGEITTCPYYDLIESLRVIYVIGVGHFVIQDVQENLNDFDSKNVTCFSLEYSTGAKYLDTFRVNTGEEDSLEYIYHAQKYGVDYSIDNPYEKASFFDAYERYFIKEYTDNDSYVYTEVKINNAEHFASYDEQLYIKAFPNIRFYHPTKPELSLLDIVFNYIPTWKIGHVDDSLMFQERTFSEDRISVYDFLCNTAAETFKYVIKWDSINGTASFYETEEDGITEDNEVQTLWDTDVFISRDNLASQIDIKYSTDDIKTKLKVTGGEDLTIRDVNLGEADIMNLSFYNTPEWLGSELFNKYNRYLEEVDEYTKQYTDLISQWAASSNKYTDLLHAVPIIDGVLRIGDRFDKLYCSHSLYNHAGEYIIDDNTPEYYIMNEDGSMSLANPQPTASNFSDGIYYIRGDLDSVIAALIKQLNLYHVDDDIDANQNDNILLRLKNKDNDTATIRIYDPKQAANNTEFNPNVNYYVKTEEYTNHYRYDRNNAITSDNYNTNNSWYMNNYKIQILIVRAATGASEAPIIRNLTSWANGDLRTSNDNVGSGLSALKGFSVSYIGTMGAYFVLAKDEKKPENLQEYGIKLLQEKKDTYTTIFQTQIEAMFAQEKYQCIVTDNTPIGTYDTGTKWLDSNSNPLTLYEYNNGWQVISNAVSTDDQSNYENYQRYIDNFEKLKTVQAVLAKKEKDAIYLLDGVAIQNRNLYGDNINYINLLAIASEYFFENTIIGTGYDSDFGVANFILNDDDAEYAVYINNNVPYISYKSSKGLCLTKMNQLKARASMENYFTQGEFIRLSPFIREDEYTNSNIILTGYESEEEEIDIKKNLLKEATKELKKLCQPKLSFSVTMANIMAMPEFAPIREQFQLGNFVKVELRENYIKRARLLEVQIKFDDLSEFSAQFGDLVTTKDEVDKTSDLLKQAVQAGKTVASNGAKWQKSVEKSNSIDKAIQEGLKDAALQVGSSSGQSIIWDNRGILGRKQIDDSEGLYEDEQFMLTNNRLVFTDNNWRSSRSVFGKFTYKGQEHFGVISDALVGGYIEGSEIVGGSLRVGEDGGNQFIVNQDGSVEIKAGGVDKYASKSDVDIVKDARRFYTEITYSDPTVFSSPGSTCKLTCNLFSWDANITALAMSKGARFSWVRNSNGDDTLWNVAHANQTSNEIVISNDDIDKFASFEVIINISDDTGL